jgi:formate hydrogenlyase subunit 5
LNHPYAAYDIVGFESPQPNTEGDALARLLVRCEEISASFHILRQVVDHLDRVSGGPWKASFPPHVDGRGIGWAEAPQGELIYCVELRDGVLARVKPRSASFHNLSLFHSVFRGDVLTDFAFIEASFGLSIAGAAG